MVMGARKQAGRWAAIAALIGAVVFAVAGALPPARADEGKKKKPGLFDFETWKTPAGHQEDTARLLAPSGIDVTPAPAAAAAPLRTMRLRIYGDRDYRSTVLRWEKKARAQIERVNQIIEPVFHARFEVESVRDWDRGHVGAPFEPVLAELEALDPARDVDWVLGLVTPFRGVATSVHQIGGAHLSSRHFVLRGMDDAEEARALDKELDLLSVDERQRTYRDRRTHKELVVFLHEWAHTMGVLHDEDPGAIMNPTYDQRRARFSDFAESAIALVIERRLGQRSLPYPESADLAALYGQAPAGEGDDKERTSLAAFLRERAAGGGAAAPGGEGRLSLPAGDVAAYNRAVTALNGGHPDEAWAALGPLVRQHPDEPQLAGLACSLVAGHPGAAVARAACDVALKLAPPANVRPALDAAGAYLRAGDRAQAAPLAMAAIAAGGAGGAGGTGSVGGAGDATTWLHAARVAMAVGALSAAEIALGRAAASGDADARKLATDVELTRHRMALPGNAARWGATAEREPAYAAAYEEVARRLSAGDLTGARARLADLGAAFADSPGADQLACDLELRARRLAVAAKRCQAAIAKYAEASRALYLLGFIEAHRHQEAAAETHLKQAITFDATEPSAWIELGHLYRTTRSNQRLAELGARHQALFSRPLPRD